MDNQYYVLERITDANKAEYSGKSYVIRAAQSTLSGAMQYIDETTQHSRFIVTKFTYEALFKKDTF